ncbi:MAG TPA: hypothetical protein VEP67_02135 [Thiobacillaceae bacterium]|nr:hypothetical protein [Thiobacillaceae bacterium]
MTELSSEDQLRLNVLMLANKVQAVRLDEGTMTLYALTDKGETKVPLHANCRTDQYLHRVKEFLGGHALGSPGGYPVYLQRWTRMGQTSDKHLDALLLLGEPEAVVAVAHAPGLTDDLARRAWWCQPTMEMARWMLEKDAVIEGRMGKVLADFLIEHLPFEENPDARMHTIRLVLFGKLTDPATTAKLWRIAKGVPYYLIGFLEFMPENLPDDQAARADYAEAEATLRPLIEAGNPYAERLLALFSANGQTWLKAATEVLAKPSTSVVVYALLDAISRHFHSMGYPIHAGTLEEAFLRSEALVKAETGGPEGLRLLREAAPQFSRSVQAMLALSALSSKLADPWLLRNTAVGALMRRKIDPMVKPIQLEIDVLRKPGH